MWLQCGKRWQPLVCTSRLQNGESKEKLRLFLKPFSERESDWAGRSNVSGC